MDYEDALEIGRETLEMIDDVDEDSRWEAADFFESVSEKLKSVLAWIEEHETVTEKQYRALENWHAAVKKFVR